MCLRGYAKEAVTVISQLQQERADPEIWNTLYEGALKLAAKCEVQPSKTCNTPRKCSGWHPLPVPEEGDVPFIHLVHHTETTGASDTRKNSSAVRSVPRLEICVNYKTKSVAGRQDGKSSY